jgi:uncharacterized membrane protein YkvA (DUF1232 family)
MKWLKSMDEKLKKDIATLYIASKRNDIGILAKLMAIIIVAYALSPIDLIPDFIPLLGYLDDLILLPLGISLVINLIPQGTINTCRKEAEDIFKGGKPRNWIAALVIVLIWTIMIARVLVLWRS